MRILVAALVAGTLAAGAGVQAQSRDRDESVTRDEKGVGSGPILERERAAGRIGHIRGFLVDPAGQGLRGMVALCTVDGRKLSLHHSSSELNGRFFMNNLRPGRYRLHVDTIGPEVTDIRPPADMEVEVRAGQVSRPQLVAR